MLKRGRADPSCRGVRAIGKAKRPILSIPARDRQERLGFKAHLVCYPEVGNLRDSDIVEVHGVVIKLTPVRDRLLDRRNSVLDVLEILIGFQLGVIFRNSEELA